MLQFIETRHAQPIDYAKAMAFIADHGHRAVCTKDGLLALTECIVAVDYHDDLVAELDDDIVFDEPAVFPIDDCGKVDARAIRDWLGY